jgi:hypothetical protein
MGMGRAAERIETLNARPSLAKAFDQKAAG